MAMKRRSESFDIEAIDRNITWAQRIEYARMTRDEVFALSPAEKLRYFVSIQVQHPILENAQEEFENYVSNVGGSKIIGLIGPTGTGKSSFFHTSVLPLFPQTRASDRPTIIVAAPAHGDKRTSINGLVRTILRSESDISVDSKLHYQMIEEGRIASVPARLDGQRDALRELLRRRRVRVLMIDEFVHAIRHTDPDSLMDSVKSIAEDVNGVVLLVGTPILLPYIYQDGPTTRRGEVIYLHRYTWDEEQQFNKSAKKAGISKKKDGQLAYAPFEHIVRRLMSRWPLEEVPEFHLIMPQIFEVTLGVVGLLKVLLATCLHRQIKNNGVWDSKFFWESSKSNAALQKIEEEIISGEKRMRSEGYGVKKFDAKARAQIAGALTTKRRSFQGPA